VAKIWICKAETKIISIFIQILSHIEANIQNITENIKKEAANLGFMACGISKAEFLEKETESLKKYLENGFHGNMKYLENHFDMRVNPSLLNEGTKSVISLIYNYFTDEKQTDNQAPIISKYAYGKDYHLVIKDKLNILVGFIEKIAGKINARTYVDSAPILEKAWAQKAGLGWIGKNGNLINRNFGSFFFIAEILVDLELDYNTTPAKDLCGKCSKCINSCPTGAIVSPRIVDARKCISYLTIELKEEIPIEFKDKLNNRVFGCDICQDVCPYNRKATPNNEQEFKPLLELMQMSKDEWFNINELTFSKLFKNSAVKRTKYEGLKRNLDFIKNHKKDQLL
jgi:epoxyqueuosine reductase